MKEENYFKGYIREINENYFYAILEKDYNLSKYLEIDNDFITDENKDFVKLGLNLRLNEETNIVEALNENFEWEFFITVNQE